MFTKPQKALIVTVVSFAATFSGFASNIYFPALPTIASDLSVSVELVNLTVTSYMIFQGIAPSFWGAIADVKGRRITYIFTFLVFLAACIGLANTKNYAMLVSLRCLQSAGSASTIAIGSGVIGDITTKAERGGLMGIFQAGLLVPVAVGPVIGGAFAGSLGWRAIFWFLTIYSGVFLIVLVLILPETLRSLVGDGSRAVQGFNRYPLRFFQRKNGIAYPLPTDSSSPPPSRTKPKSINLLGPLRILCNTDVVGIIVFLSIYYTVWQMSLTATSTLFRSTYHLSETIIGLTFLANGTGCMLGTLLTGKLLDWDYRRTTSAKPTSINQPTDPTTHYLQLPVRLRTLPYFIPLQFVSVLVYGWTLRASIHPAVPLIFSFFIGFAAIAIQTVVTTFLVDLYPDTSASATAALNLARCLMGAGGTAAVMPLVDRLGVGGGFSLCVGVMGVGVLGIGWGSRKVEEERDEKVARKRSGRRWRTTGKNIQGSEKMVDREDQVTRVS